MASTITSYTTFVAGTKARASEVNNNFSNHRGDLPPIYEDTATASDGVHNLGTSDHRWLTVYANTVNLKGATSTGHLIWSPDTSVTLGALNLLGGANTIASIKFGYFGFVANTTTNFFSFLANSETNGAFEIKMGANTMAVWSYDNGLSGSAIGKTDFTTTAAVTAAPQRTYIFTAETTPTVNISSAGSAQTISVQRIQAQGGGIMMVGLANCWIDLQGDPTSWQFEVRIYRGNTTTALTEIWDKPVVARSGGQNFAYDFIFYDTSYTAGEVVYELRSFSNAAHTTTAAVQYHGCMVVKEL